MSGAVTAEQIAEQATIRKVVLAATEYAHDHGVTLVAAAGNGHTNYALPTRSDATSPDYPPGTEAERVVTSNCLDLPSEAPDVISVSSVGPSGTKSDFSNYGLGSVEVSAPGGWFRDGIGTPTFQTPANEILSSYPLDLGDRGGALRPGHPAADRRQLRRRLQRVAVRVLHVPPGHVDGLAARGGRGRPDRAGARATATRQHGYSLDPDTVKSILLSTATDHACPAGGTEIYTDEGRPAEFNAVCDGTTANNGLYGEGIVNAAAAVATST